MIEIMIEASGRNIEAITQNLKFRGPKNTIKKKKNIYIVKVASKLIYIITLRSIVVR